MVSQICYKVTMEKSLNLQWTRYSEKNKIWMIKSSLQNPQVQGKVERSNQQFHKKVMYDVIGQDRAGFNWVQNLQQYIEC